MQRSLSSAAHQRLHRLETVQSKTKVKLADGSDASTVDSTEIASLKLQIQGHRIKCKFIVIDMIPGFGVVLGEDWSYTNQVMASYGRSQVPCVADNART